jgi:hypothetical protein
MPRVKSFNSYGIIDHSIRLFCKFVVLDWLYWENLTRFILKITKKIGKQNDAFKTTIGKKYFNFIGYHRPQRLYFTGWQ